MYSHLVTSCTFARKEDGKKERGLYVYVRKTNTRYIFDKNMQSVSPVYNCWTDGFYETSSVLFDLNRKI